MNRKYRFFVIDDDTSFTRTLIETLSSEGHSVYAGSAGSDTVSKIVAHRPSCIIMDTAASGRDSAAIIRHLRGIHGLSDTRIVLLSIDQSDQIRQEALAAGADELIPKAGGVQEVVCDLKQLLENEIRFIFWGVHGTLTVPGHKTVRYGGNTPCVSLHLPGDALFIFDAGSGIKEFSNHLIAEHRTQTKGSIFISHPHWDHIHGLPFFAPLYSKENSFNIYGPLRGTVSLRELIAEQMNGTYFPIHIKEFGARLSFHDLGEEQLVIGGATIQTMFLEHPGECLGYRLDYKGKSFCYVTDHELYPHSSDLYDGQYIRKLEAFIAGTDVLISDTTYMHEEYEDKIGWGHSSVNRVVELADRAGVKKLYLFHHDLDQTDDDIDKKLETARAVLAERGASTLCIAPKEGETFNV